MKSESQAGQDLFVWEMTEHKTDGYYLDLGCNDAVFHSNTYALEQLGWTGLLVDVVGGCESRKGTFVRCDATQPSERLLFLYSQMPVVVDYLSLDVDQATIPALKTLPFATHTFRIITVEHDAYTGDNSRRSEIRSFLSGLGYNLVCADVCVEWPPGTKPVPFEDWWCFPDLISPALVSTFQCENQFWKDILGRAQPRISEVEWYP